MILHMGKSIPRDSLDVTSVADLIDIAGRLPAVTVAIVGGDRVEDLRLVESAVDHGIVDRIILVGQRDRIVRSVAEAKIEVHDDDIVYSVLGL